jgi:hypothetical protein
VSQITPYTPARSRWFVSSFSVEESNIIFLSCRKHQLAFSNVFPVIGQIALTRVLLRQYLCGKISDDEWEFRKREPMSHAGPWNLRPFLDKDWVEAGGLANVCLSIGFIAFSLPYMPLGSASTMRPGMSLPSYGELLSLRRFILRSKAIRDQSVCYMKHPLFLELAAFSLPGQVARLAGVAQQWRKSKGPPAHFNDKSLTPAEQASPGLVISTGGTSIGNVGCQICHLSICSPNLLPEGRSFTSPGVSCGFEETNYFPENLCIKDSLSSGRTLPYCRDLTATIAHKYFLG